MQAKFMDLCWDTCIIQDIYCQWFYFQGDSDDNLTSISILGSKIVNTNLAELAIQTDTDIIS